MSGCTCTFIVDTGAEISIFKQGKVKPTQILNPSKRFKVTGITEGFTNTIGETSTNITFPNGLTVNHSFQLVNNEFPILTDGILGRDLFIKFKCTIDYESWLLNFNFQNCLVSVPIEDNIDNSILIPARCEVIRKIPNFCVTRDSVVLSQEILPGVFCANTIVSPNAPYVKIINTTRKQIAITNFRPKIDPLENYNKTNTQCNNKKFQNDGRLRKILSEINMDQVPTYLKPQLVELINKFPDIFCLPGETLSTNN